MGFLFYLFICAFFYQNSSGSFILSTNLEASDPTLNVAAHRFRMLLGHDYELAPASTQTASGHRGHRFIPSPLVPTQKNHFRGKGHHISTFSHNEPAVPTPSSLSSSRGQIPKGPLSLPAFPSHHSHMPSRSPAISPGSSPSVNYEKTLPPIQSMTLSPRPTNQECASLTCTKPLTYAPPGAHCGCVWPIEVKLCFSIPLYTFLPLLSNLSDSIAASIPLNRSQVLIMGADAAEQQLDKTTVLFNLVPLGEMFKYTSAFLIYSKFWNKELSIKTLFGAYEVLYVRYPGLPPSPPSWASASAIVDIQPNPSSRDGGEAIKPLGVFVPQSRKSDPGKNMVLMIIVSSVTAFVACIGFLLLLLSKCGCCGYLHRHDQQSRVSSDEKASVAGSDISRSRPSSASVSLSSSLLLFTGTAKVFTIEEIERATDNFNASRILGEGGFGIVYRGILNDGRNVAVKVLKREDQQGSREFLAEVEMLSRLHHRNLVTLLGICPEDQRRCLVYELVPNGSVDSHLHGADKEAGALDWCARMKIALGSARGLAYLHEDSSPRVIHRDFKSSNILLEHDFTPKVSDFGLARTAMEEQNKHISTHVMGTFGYLAPEYAMTGHLLVKSDVYSYGVVLLELITGRKPIDMSRPPGQENLVAWARSLLPTRQGLETIIDPHLKPSISFDTFAKVSAIASMCIQPEVSHRPFMGEVVQALKLVCNEIEETKEPISRSCSYEGLCIEVESKHSITASNELVQDLEKCESMFDAQTAFSVVEMEKDSESFRRQFNSAPLKVGRQQSVWQRLRGLSRGSTSEHEYSSKQ